LRLSRPSSRLALFKVFILSQSLLSLLDLTGMKINSVYPEVSPLSMGVEKFSLNR
jgi:hypothetical protein